MSTVWTWADKSSVICVCLLELAREKCTTHQSCKINTAPQRLTQKRFPGKCSPSFIICPGRRKHKARTSHRQRSTKARDTLHPPKPHGGGWGYPCGGRQHPTPSRAGRRMTGSALAVIASLGSSPFPSEKDGPKAEYIICLRGGRAMDDPPQHQKQGNTDYNYFLLDMSPHNVPGCLSHLYEATMCTWSLLPAPGTRCYGVRVRITHGCTRARAYSAAQH